MLTTESPITESDEQSFRRDGFIVARQLLSPEEVATLREAFMEENRNGPVEGLSEIRHQNVAFDRNDPLAFYPRMMHPHRHPDKQVGRLASQYLIDDRIGAILRQLMQEEPLAVQTMFYFKPPGARGQELHQDNFYLRVKPGTCMAAWIALDDCDEENGGMACVPSTANLDVQCPQQADPTKSFTTEHVPPPPGSKAEVVKMAAGDVLFFNGSTIHGSGPNRSATRFRRSLICHYVPASTAQMSDWYQAIDFRGNARAIQLNTDGGPCGTPFTGAVH